MTRLEGIAEHDTKREALGRREHEHVAVRAGPFEGSVADQQQPVAGFDCDAFGLIAYVGKRADRCPFLL